uniref:Putative secreted protein n=1 Tax=Ixodes ricinus TaxID=34613 RepID=A0A6B0U7C7_IXORI
MHRLMFISALLCSWLRCSQKALLLIQLQSFNRMSQNLKASNAKKKKKKFDKTIGCMQSKMEHIFRCKNQLEMSVHYLFLRLCYLKSILFYLDFFHHE